MPVAYFVVEILAHEQVGTEDVHYFLFHFGVAKSHWLGYKIDDGLFIDFLE